MVLSTSRHQTLHGLRARIQELERGGRAPESDAAAVVVSGARGAHGEALRLARGALHEVLPETPFDAAASGFAAAALAGALTRSPRPALWVTTRRASGEGGRPLGRGLASFGCDPARLILVEARRNDEALWALEEAGRSGAVAGALGEVEALSFTQSRRLAMAAAAGRTPLLLLRPAGADGASAATTRWRIGARPAERHPADQRPLGRPRWRAGLIRARDGRRGAWDLTFHGPDEDDATLSGNPASGSSDRAPAADVA